jgi:hypothetical protein
MAGQRKFQGPSHADPIVCLILGNELSYLAQNSGTNRVSGRRIDGNGGDPPELSAPDKISALSYFSSSRVGLSASEAAEVKIAVTEQAGI